MVLDLILWPKQNQSEHLHHQPKKRQMHLQCFAIIKCEACLKSSCRDSGESSSFQTPLEIGSKLLSWWSCHVSEEHFLFHCISSFQKKALHLKNVWLIQLGSYCLSFAYTNCKFFFAVPIYDLTCHVFCHTCHVFLANNMHSISKVMNLLLDI